MLAAANEPGCEGLTPHQIVPSLADEGCYLASESTFYRLLKAAGQARRRGRGYDDIKSAITYLQSSIPKFAAEAAALCAWRDAVGVFGGANSPFAYVQPTATLPAASTHTSDG